MNEPVNPSDASRGLLRAVDRVLYPSSVGFTLVILAFQFYEFAKGGAFRPQWPFAEVYLAVLTAYAAQRELVKWKGVEEPSLRLRRGELFVAGWLAVWLLVTALANLYPRFAMPVELSKITLGVLGIFAVSGASAGLRSGRSAGQRRDDEELKRLIVEMLKKGPASIQEVADAVGIPKTNTYRLLEKLEKDGTLVQDQSENARDRRYRLK